MCQEKCLTEIMYSQCVNFLQKVVINWQKLLDVYNNWKESGLNECGHV